MLSAEEEAKILRWLGAESSDQPFLLTFTDRQKRAILSMIDLAKDQLPTFFPGMAAPTTHAEKVAFLQFLLEIVKHSETEYAEATLVHNPSWEASHPDWLFPNRTRFSSIVPGKYLQPLRITESCDRCGDVIYGNYYTLESNDLCRRCMRRVRVRRRMLAAKPNREVKSLLKAALMELRRAARYDRQDQQIKTNLKNIRRLLSSAGGSGATYYAFWVPLWLIVGAWDCLTSLQGLIACVIGGPFAVYWLSGQGGDTRTVGMVVGAVLGLAVLLGGVRWIRRGWHALPYLDWDDVTGWVSRTLQDNAVFRFLQYIARFF